MVNPLFAEDALAVINDFAGGIARKVNNVCTSCLLDTFAQRKTLIDDRMVKIVIENEFAVLINKKLAGSRPWSRSASLGLPRSKSVSGNHGWRKRHVYGGFERAVVRVL